VKGYNGPWANCPSSKPIRTGASGVSESVNRGGVWLKVKISPSENRHMEGKQIVKDVVAWGPGGMRQVESNCAPLGARFQERGLKNGPKEKKPRGANRGALKRSWSDNRDRQKDKGNFYKGSLEKPLSRILEVPFREGADRSELGKVVGGRAILTWERSSSPGVEKKGDERGPPK